VTLAAVFSFSDVSMIIRNTHFIVSHFFSFLTGAMAALGIFMLIIALGGGLALLVYVFKW
jgi:hypothetical protein